MLSEGLFAISVRLLLTSDRSDPIAISTFFGGNN